MVSFNEMISNLHYEVNQINNILSFNSKRDVPEEQISIKLEHRISTIIGIIDDISHITNLPIERINEHLGETLDKISEIVFCKLSSSNSLARYNLEMLRLSIACTLMSSWGKAGFLRIWGSAKALSNLLIGFEIIDLDQISFDYNHPEFMKRRALLHNMCNYWAGLFYIASTSLYNISSSELEEWAVKALKGNEQMLTIIENNWNIRFLIMIEKRTRRKITAVHCIDTLEVFNAMVKYLLLLGSRYSNGWPKTTKSISFVDTTNTEKFIDSVNLLLKKQQYYIDDLITHVEQGFFNINDNPLEMPKIKSTLKVSKINNYMLQSLKIVSEISKGDDQLLVNSLKILLLDMKFLLEKEQQFTDVQLLSTRWGETLMGLLKYYIFFTGVYSLYTKDTDILIDLEESLGVFFSIEGRKRYPQLYSLLLSGILATASKTNQQNVMLETAEKMIETAEYFLFQPRDAFAFTLLGHLVKLVLGKIEQNLFFDVMNEALMKIEVYVSNSLKSEIDEYLAALRIAIDGKEPIYEIKRISSPSPFEPYSFLIPELSSYAKKLNYGNIEYLPFNLESDYITIVD